jgi:hypothetical protein
MQEEHGGPLARPLINRQGGPAGGLQAAGGEHGDFSLFFNKMKAGKACHQGIHTPDFN